MCIQETLIPDNGDLHPPSHYKIVRSAPVRRDGHERGTALLIHNRVHFTPLGLRTTLQAAAVTVYLNRKYTVCSIYLPHHQISGVELEDLIGQLPQPFLLLGDVNARSTLWGCPATDLRGRLLEDLIFNHPISVLNDGTATHYHVQTDTYSTIDLSACSSDIFDDLEYKVLASRYSSDHYPIRVSWKTAPIVLSAQPRYKTDSANWAQFRCLTEIAGDIDVGTTDDLLQSIKDVIISAADASIPMSSGRITRPPVPWWNNQCREAKRSRNIAERALRRHYSLANKIRYSRA